MGTIYCSVQLGFSSSICYSPSMARKLYLPICDVDWLIQKRCCPGASLLGAILSARRTWSGPSRAVGILGDSGEQDISVFRLPSRFPNPIGYLQSCPQGQLSWLNQESLFPSSTPWTYTSGCQSYSKCRRRGSLQEITRSSNNHGMDSLFLRLLSRLGSPQFFNPASKSKGNTCFLWVMSNIRYFKTIQPPYQDACVYQIVM